jgi:D-alanyl-D-alanine carboxypeptidase (penicillin-binding protein 5/6)
MMFKVARRICLALGLAATVAGGIAGPAVARARFVTTESKYAAIVMDAASGEVLYERNPDAERYPASISKIMTLYLTFEALSTGRLRLTDQVTVSQHAASMAPSRLGLRPGGTISVDDAMRAVAVKSANDMAVALAERIGGSESRFAALMTLRAQELGMTHTHYVNASGLPDVRQISSARDIAILSRAVMRDYPQYYGYFSIRQFAWGGQVTRNHNGLLGKMPGLDGLKTGFINASGFNLAASAVRENHRLIAVVLGGNSTAARDAHVEDLLDTGFTVEHRRALGEKIEFAQNLFEPAPIGPISRPPTEEGSADQDGVHIVLTNTEAASLHAAQGETAAASKPADGREGASRDRAASSNTGWTVQVGGAYRRKGQARSDLAMISRKFSAQLGDADRGVEAKGRHYYRARFSGLSGADARQACRAMRAHHLSCEVVSPRA